MPQRLDIPSNNPLCPVNPHFLLVKSLCVFSCRGQTSIVGWASIIISPIKKSPVWGVSMVPYIFRPDQWPSHYSNEMIHNYSNEIAHVFSSVAFLWLSRPPTPWSSDRAASHHRNLQTNGAANGRIVVLDGLARDLGMGQHLWMWVKQ